jgi:hypothetical protein
MLSSVRRITLYTLAGTGFGAVYQQYQQRKNNENLHSATCHLQPISPSHLSGHITFTHVSGEIQESSIMTGKFDNLNRYDVNNSGTLDFHFQKQQENDDASSSHVMKVNVNTEGYISHSCVPVDVSNCTLYVQRSDNGKKLASGPVIKCRENNNTTTTIESIVQ